MPVFYEAVVPAMNADQHGLSGIGVRTSRWKFVLYNNGRAELYDLVKDPHELTNLVWTHGAPKVVAALTDDRQRPAPLQGRQVPHPAAEEVPRDR